jgi:hypothetical protein
MRAVNLIPAEQRAGAGGTWGRSEGAVYVLLTVMAGLALVIFLYGKARHEISSRKAQVATMNAKAQRAQEAATSLAPYTSFLSLREQREQAVSQLVDARFDWAHVFHELGRVLPPATSITSLAGSVGSSSATGSAASPGAAGSSSSSSSSTAGAGATGASSSGGAVSSATPPGSVPTFTLSGCATSQAVVAATLNRLRLIDGVSEVTLQSSTKSDTAGAGASGPGGGCGRGPAFTILLTFQPLPSADTARAAAVTRNVSSGGAR